MSNKKQKLEDKYEYICELLGEQEVQETLIDLYGVEDIGNLSITELKEFIEHIITENMLEGEMEDIEYKYHKNKIFDEE